MINSPGQERGHSPINALGATYSRDDSTPLLSTDKTLFRDGKITIFGFRTYLLSRQWHLSVKRHEYLPALEKVVKFIPSFAQSLREVEVSRQFLRS